MTHEKPTKGELARSEKPIPFDEALRRLVNAPPEVNKGNKKPSGDKPTVKKK